MMQNWAGVGGIVGIVYFAITMIDCYGWITGYVAERGRLEDMMAVY